MKIREWHCVLCVAAPVLSVRSVQPWQVVLRGPPGEQACLDDPYTPKHLQIRQKFASEDALLVFI